MTRVALALTLALLAGCASIAKVETGDRQVGERMTIHLTGAWNHVNAPGLGPAELWTMEGLPVDQLMLYSGITDGQLIHADMPAAPNIKSFSFRSGMQPDEIVSMFEGMLTRDGSKFVLVKLEPATFGGERGFRFHFTLTRKRDNVRLLGIAAGAVSGKELFTILYIAPRLGFFPRHVGDVERIMHSARIRQ